MVGFTALVAACAAVTGAVAAPSLQNVTASGLDKRQVTPNQEGTHNGYFFSWWSDGASPVTYTNGAGGSYSVQWQSGGNLVGGKGWNPGHAREISYQATWEPVNNGNSYLTVYGWTRSPLVEYYIVEAHGEYNPCSSAQSRGSVTHAGSSYQLCESTRTQQPSIDGTQTFQQYWAVRQNHRTSGTVDTGFFFNAWAQAGMPLGNHYYMVLATEAYRSAGRAQVTILEGGSTPNPEPTQPTQPGPQPTQNPGGGGNCSARWGQCGGQGWAGPTCCESGTTCRKSNDYYSQCL